MLRALVSLLLGAAVTFGLFAFMAFLVSFGGERLDKSEKTPPLVINPEKNESKTQTKTRFKPKPPPPPDQPPPPAEVEPDTTDDSAGMKFDLPSVDVGGVSTGLDAPGAGMGRDGDATPIVRIEPRYPIKAARDGKEGYVILSFSINEIGGVEDVKVLEAEPKRLFDKEARRALKRWKYKPQVIDGKAQKVTGQTVRLDFTLPKKGK